MLCFFYVPLTSLMLSFHTHALREDVFGVIIADKSFGAGAQFLPRPAARLTEPLGRRRRGGVSRLTRLVMTMMMIIRNNQLFVMMMNIVMITK